jgi:AcrR family transcriptional regulator
MSRTKTPANRRKRRPVTRGDKRERTRLALIEAAASVFAEQGLERASLEAIAARARMTRGAIYGNFRDKHELILAVAEHYWTPILPPPADGARTFRDRMRALGKAVAKAAPQRARAGVAAASFMLYALQHEDMRELVEQKNAELYATAAAALRNAPGDDAPPLPVNTLVRVIHAMMEGLFALHALTPELIDEDVIIRAFEALCASGPNARGVQLSKPD